MENGEESHCMKYWVALLGGLSVATVFHWLLGRTASQIIFYTALPGVILHLVITGGHGGTIMEDRFGSVLEVVVNAVFYAALLWGLGMLGHRIRASKTSD
jgi:hypothetical protein